LGDEPLIPEPAHEFSPHIGNAMDVAPWFSRRAAESVLSMTVESGADVTVEYEATGSWS
jgi:hypothetical protein